MRKSVIFSGVIVLTCLSVGIADAKKPESTVRLFAGQPAAAAADALAEVALLQAGGGSWERIAVGRVFYLSGQKERGQAVFDAVLAGDAEPSDWIRIGRVYFEGGNWAEARELFEMVLKKKPKDADWLAEIGAYFNLKGDRDRAEELFARSFAEEPKSDRNTAIAAGSYVGVVPDP
jgi:tetratricopeptide (TPR) repeat protein